jgi:uncharacterized membrane protein
MFDRDVLLAITALGFTSYALRVGGFLAAGAIPPNRSAARFLRKAPGNVIVAFVAAACLESRWPALFGCASAVAVMIITRREWAALAVGFIVAGLMAVLPGVFPTNH